MSKRTLQLIESALRLSAHVLHREPQQLAGQLCGRLRPSDTGMDRLFGQFGARTKPWLRPLTPSLESAGGALLRIFAAPRGVSGDTDASRAPWEVTRDGHRLVAACRDGRIRMWDLPSGELLLTLERRWSGMPALALEPGGATLVTSGRRGGLLRWDLEAGRVVAESATPEGLSPDELDELPEITALAVTSDGQRIFTGDVTGGLCVWDAASLLPLRRFGEGAGGTVLRALVPPDGGGALSVREGYPGILVQRWDLAAGDELGALRYAGEYGATALALAPDGRRLAAYDDRVRVWDLGPERTEPFAVARPTTGFDVPEDEGVFSLDFSPDGRRLAAGGGGGSGRGGAGMVRVWSLESGDRLHVLEGHDDTVRAVLWDPEGGRLLSGSDDGTVKLWDPTADAGLDYGRGHARQVDAAAISPAGTLAVSGTEGDIRLWSLESGLEVGALAYEGDPPRQIAFSPDGGLLALQADGFRVWDVGSRREAARFPAPYAGEFAFVFDRRWIAAASEDLGCLLVWDLEAPAEARVLKGPDAIRSLALTSDGDGLAVLLDRDPSPRVWDTRSGRVQATLLGHSGGSYMEGSHGWVSAVAALPHTRRIALASYEGTVGLWDLDSGREAESFTLGGAWAASMAATPDGTGLVCGCGDHRIRVVDLASRGVAFSLAGHEGPVNVVVLTSEGRQVVSGASDGTIRVWDLATRRATSSVACQHDVEDLAASADGLSVFVAGDAKAIQVWRLASGDLAPAFVKRGGGASRLVMTPDGARLITAAHDGTLRAWSLATRRMLWEVPGARAGALTLSQDGRRLFSGDWDGRITVRTPETGREVDGPAGLGDPELTVVPASGGEPATTARFAGWWTLRRGNATTAIAPRPPEALRLRVGSAARWAAAPAGRRVVTAAGDRVTLWGGSGPKPIASLSVGGSVTSLALSPDEATVIVGTGSGRVHLLRLEAAVVREIAGGAP